MVLQRKRGSIVKLEYAFPLALPRFHLAYDMLIVKSS